MKTGALLQRSLIIAAMVCMTVVSTIVSAQPFVEGKHYRTVETQGFMAPGPEGKVEVREFFWYGCSHCYALEPYIAKWEKPDFVKFVLTPAVLGAHWVDHARTYYALQQLNQEQALHKVLFDAIHKGGKRLFTLGQIGGFVEGYGVKREDFEAATRSFLVGVEIKRADRLVKQYQIDGVPIFVIGGKYVTSPGMAGSYPTFFEIVNYLVNKAKPRG